MIKRTQIICTIGPATESQEMLQMLLQEGMNIMRLNFSHGDFAEHQARILNLKKAQAEIRVKALVMQDLCGPKIRIGDFEHAPITLEAGQEFILTTEPFLGNKEKVHINYEKLPGEVKIGQHIFLHDGRKKL